MRGTIILLAAALALAGTVTCVSRRVYYVPPSKSAYPTIDRLWRASLLQFSLVLSWVSERLDSVARRLAKRADRGSA